MQVRVATSNDKEAVLGLLDELGRSGNRISQNAEPQKIGTIFDEVISRKDTCIFVVEENNKLIALATFYLIPYIRHGTHRGQIEDFVVSESYRGKGIGSILFNGIKEYCKKNGISVVKLTTRNNNFSAQKFYEKNEGKQTEKMYRFDLKI